VRWPYGSGWYSAAGRLLTMPHNVAQWRVVGGAVAGHDSQAHSAVDSPLTRTSAGVSALNAPAGGAGMGVAARDALERDGNSLEGAFGSRSRQCLARGGASSPRARRMDPYSRGRSTHERGGFVSRRCRTPRVERSSARGWLGRLSDGPWACRFVLCA
jgi:hypothetical protein